MQTQRLRKMDFLLEKCNGEKQAFQKHESFDSHTQKARVSPLLKNQHFQIPIRSDAGP